MELFDRCVDYIRAIKSNLEENSSKVKSALFACLAITACSGDSFETSNIGERNIPIAQLFVPDLPPKKPGNILTQKTAKNNNKRKPEAINLPGYITIVLHFKDGEISNAEYDLDNSPDLSDFIRYYNKGSKYHTDIYSNLYFWHPKENKYIWVGYIPDTVRENSDKKGFKYTITLQKRHKQPYFNGKEFMPFSPNR